MTTDLTVILENGPGTMADMGETLGNAGINMEGAFGFPWLGKEVTHILAEDAAAARNALEAAGFEVRDERKVLLIEAEDRPGEGGKIGRRLADASVNADPIYFSTTGKLVLGVDDLEKARAILP